MGGELRLRAPSRAGAESTEVFPRLERSGSRLLPAEGTAGDAIPVGPGSAGRVVAVPAAVSSRAADRPAVLSARALDYQLCLGALEPACGPSRRFDVCAGDIRVSRDVALARKARMEETRIADGARIRRDHTGDGNCLARRATDRAISIRPLRRPSSAPRTCLRHPSFASRTAWLPQASRPVIVAEVAATSPHAKIKRL